jgi:hypothetical protein
MFLLGTFLICFNIIAQNNIKRSPDVRKDYVNVFYNPQYTLFDFWSDEPIFPDSNGNYNIYTAINENRTPKQFVGKAYDIQNNFTYKFKNYSNCKNWCDRIEFKANSNIVNQIDTVEKVAIELFDFGISQISFVELGNKNYGRIPEERILESKLRESLCYSVGNYLQKSTYYDSLMGMRSAMRSIACLIALKLELDTTKEISPLFFLAMKGIVTNLTLEDVKGKSVVGEIFNFAFWYRNNYKALLGLGCSTPSIRIQAYPFDFEEKARLADLKKKSETSNNQYESGARNYCISTSNNKYILSLFDDGSKKVIYKLYDKNGNLTKTIQGLWEIKDEGVYGSAYFLSISWTGVNSNMANLKFMCQYNANRELQSIIDSQGRTWFECQ